MASRIAGVFDARLRGAAGRLERLGASSRVSDARGWLHLACAEAAIARGGCLCAMTGVLDNADELAAQLGADARADSIAPLLVRGYRRWGNRLPARMRGDFSLVLWDEERACGLIARDQLGAECLYLHSRDGALFFASELHDLLALLPRRPCPDPASVAHWIVASNRPGPYTLFDGVRRLAAGSLIALDGRETREQRYWTPAYAEPPALPSEQLAVEVRDAIERAVARRVSTAGRTAVLLSGGLDSSCVAAAAVDAGASPIACSGVFPEHPAADESLLIGQLRSRLGLAGPIAEVRAGGLVGSVIDSLRTWQVPPKGWGDFWTLPLLRAAACHGAAVVLGGDGGDELFGSRSYAVAERLRDRQLRQALSLALSLPGAGDRPARAQVARVLVRFGLLGALPYRLHDGFRRIFAARQEPRWLLPAARAALLESDDPLAWKLVQGPRSWAHLADGLSRGIEESGLFEHHRRRAALAGMRARHPLLDLELIELILRQRPESSLDPHRNRPLLRASMSGKVPDGVRMRPAKAWFDTLILESLQRSDGGALPRLLGDRGSELSAYVDAPLLRRELLETGRGSSLSAFQRMHLSWRLVTGACWLKSEADGLDSLCSLVQPSSLRISIKDVTPLVSSVFPP